MNNNLTKPLWKHRINHKNEYVRVISGLLIVFLIFIPLPAWLLLFREGYSNATRVGWGLYTFLLWPLLLGIVFWLFVGIVALIVGINPSNYLTTELFLSLF